MIIEDVIKGTHELLDEEINRVGARRVLTQEPLLLCRGAPPSWHVNMLTNPEAT